jgi:hypothetical protein
MIEMNYTTTNADGDWLFNPIQLLDETKLELILKGAPNMLDNVKQGIDEGWIVVLEI